MRYHVNWSPEAEEELAAIWLTSTQRAEVTRAQHAIERALAADPQIGRLLSEGLFTFEIGPLKVYYSILEPERMVGVTDVIPASSQQ